MPNSKNKTDQEKGDEVFTSLVENPSRSEDREGPEVTD
jgi:hypothetical protein